MAHWIDRASLWLFAAISSLILFYAVTDGSLLLSVPLAFFSVLLIRLLVHNLPNRRLFTRKTRLREINLLLNKWALTDEQKAIDEIKALLPSLFRDSSPACIRLVQRLPDSDPLTANQLIDLRRAYRGENTLYLICTGPVSSAAEALIASPLFPQTHLADSCLLTRLLLKSNCPLPAVPKKNKRCRPSPACIAQLTQSIKPIRSVLYLLVFSAMFLLTGSIFYLLTAAVFALQLMILLILRITAGRQPA